MWRLVAALGAVAACGTDTGCPMTIAAYCAEHADCQQGPPGRWAQASDAARWGSPLPPCASCPIDLETCPHEELALDIGIDSGIEYHYNAAGGLDRITASGATGHRSCIAGDIPDPGEPDWQSCTDVALDLCCKP